MIKIIKKSDQIMCLLTPVKEYKISDKLSCLLDINFNYFLKALTSKSDTGFILEKSYSVIPISKSEVKLLLKGEIQINDIFKGVFVSYKIIDTYNCETYNSDREIEEYHHSYQP